MTHILSQELRERAEAVTNRFQSEAQLKKEKEAQEKAQLKQAALEDFRKALLRTISEEFMQRLDIKIKTKVGFGNTGWQIEEGPYKGSWSQEVVFASIELPHDCSIEIHGGTRWKLSVPALSENKKRWVAPETYESLDFQKATLEDFILLALLDFEENQQESCML